MTGKPIDAEDIAVLLRLQAALPNVGLNGWFEGVRVLARVIEHLTAAQQQGQAVACVCCEDKPAPGNNPCGWCGRTAPPSAPVGVKTLSEFMAEQEALHPGIHDKVQAATDELRASLAQQPAAGDGDFINRIADSLIEKGWDIDPNCDGTGVAQLREAVISALAQQPAAGEIEALRAELGVTKEVAVRAMRQRDAQYNRAERLAEVLMEYGLPLTGDDIQDALEFGDEAVAREKRRRAALEQESVMDKSISECKQARSHDELIAELLDSRVPKTERENALQELDRWASVTNPTTEVGNDESE